MIKGLTEKLLILLLIILFLPIWGVLYVIIKLTSPGPFIFKQKRLGQNKKPFTIYKIRTMIKEAENQRMNYAKFNEADGPLFKIKNDPRLTIIGRFLSKSGIDETPQLINIIKGEMALVGPRPFPIYEADKIPKKYNKRFSALPGMTSISISKGAHQLSFDDWMRQDVDYIEKKSAWMDFIILIDTIRLIMNHFNQRS
ncbi:MAG TPA: sugar transferase [Patescibacteria group bacterium]|nr:sugar transferase [Patescibacteria group bacterium]